MKADMGPEPALEVLPVITYLFIQLFTFELVIPAAAAKLTNVGYLVRILLYPCKTW
jgi:hypothetical protein